MTSPKGREHPQILTVREKWQKLTKISENIFPRIRKEREKRREKNRRGEERRGGCTLLTHVQLSGSSSRTSEWLWPSLLCCQSLLFNEPNSSENQKIDSNLSSRWLDPVSLKVLGSCEPRLDVEGLDVE